MTVHLDPGGSDEKGNGSRGRPVATLARAVALCREKGGRRIVAAGGVYPGTEAALTAADSGLTLAAAPGAEPCFYGGVRLEGWRAEDGAVPFWSAPAPAGLDLAQGLRVLVVNGRLAPRARYPESGAIRHASDFPVRWMSTTKGGWERKPTPEELSTLKLVPGSLPEGMETGNAELTLYHSWDESLVGVREWDRAAGLLRFTTPAGHPPGAFGSWKEQARTFVVWNVREGLTRPGQWYLDKGRGRIVYWPLPEEKPEALEAWAPVRGAVLRLEGTEAAPVRNVRLRGLVFGLTATPLVAGGFGALAFGGAVEGRYAPGLRIEDCAVRWAGGQGIRVLKSDRVLVRGGTVRETGAGGVVLEGKGGRVEGLLVHHVGRTYPSALALRVHGADWRVRRNTFHHTPYSAVNAGGTNLLFEANRFHHIMEELVDGASIYVFAGKRCRLRGNYTYALRDEQVHAYYLDEQSEDSVVEGNVADGAPWPIHNHMAWNCVLRDNVCLHDGKMKISFHNCDRFDLQRNVFACGGELEISSSYTGLGRLRRNAFSSRSGGVRWEFTDRLPSLERNGGPVAALPAAGSSVAGDPGGRCEGGRIVYGNAELARRLGLKALDVSGAGCGREE